MTDQLILIAGGYRCHNCGRDVKRTRKAHRFWLCDDCWPMIMPQWEKTVKKEGREPAWYAETAEQQAAIAKFWEWKYDMEEFYPLAFKAFRFVKVDDLLMPIMKNPFAGHVNYLSMAKKVPAIPYSTDAYYPLCECGRPRPEHDFKGARDVRGLFGGPFKTYCEVCQAKREVESLLRLDISVIHPDWDDEAWLDALYKTMRPAFDLGVLPDYWYELRRGQLTARKMDDQPDSTSGIPLVVKCGDG